MSFGACGGGNKQDANEPRGNFTVDVTRASFPASQKLAEQSRMTITVKNTGEEQVPNLVVTLRSGRPGASGGGGTGSSSQDAFGYRTSQPGVADATRPTWVIDRGPDQVQREGSGGAVTAYVNTWALGPLAKGRTKSFTWDVTPVRPGTYGIDWRVSAGLDGKAIAKLGSGRIPEGSFTVAISNKPAQATVGPNGEVIRGGD
ncbi:MAG: hypothetical protein QOH13_2306 [Thermoleophilaceae bacterium]|jgi:hypothetical protein|nr:hypothetical protein [Thermoleophilaceae bacterium]